MKKSVLIIGASSDIGLATAKKFAKMGYALALTYNTNKIDFKNELLETKFKSYKLNLENNQEIENFFNQLSHDFPILDSMVICSGIAQKRKLIFDVTDDEISQIFKINTLSTIKCVKEFCKMTINKYETNIILVGSFVEKNGCSCESVYTASKSALSGLCKSLATELGNFGLRINVVAPGFIDTKMNNSLTKAEKEDIADITPLSRLGNADDVANAIYFLASQEASYITGQTLFVDGGLMLQ